MEQKQKTTGEILRSLVRQHRKDKYDEFVNIYQKMFEDITKTLYNAAKLGLTSECYSAVINTDVETFSKYIKRYFENQDISTEITTSYNLSKSLKSRTVQMKFSWGMETDN